MPRGVKMYCDMMVISLPALKMCNTQMSMLIQFLEPGNYIVQIWLHASVLVAFEEMDIL